MRLRITHQLKGTLDGVALDRFRVGDTYEVGTAIGSYLLALDAAILVIDGRPVAQIPPPTSRPRKPSRKPIRKQR